MTSLAEALTRALVTTVRVYCQQDSTGILGPGQRSWLPPDGRPDLGPWLVATQGSGQAAGGSWALVPDQLLALLVA